MHTLSVVPSVLAPLTQVTRPRHRRVRARRQLLHLSLRVHRRAIDHPHLHHSHHPLDVDPVPHLSFPFQTSPFPANVTSMRMPCSMIPSLVVKRSFRDS